MRKFLIRFLLFILILLFINCNPEKTEQLSNQQKKIDELEQDVKYLKGEYNKSIPVFIPKRVFFCGEKVPLDKFGVKERLEQALINERSRSTMYLIFLRSGRWFPLIEQKIKEKNLPEDLKYIAVIESGLDLEVGSWAGAIGLWQFTRDTGRRYLKINSYIDERLDPERATDAALEHLEELYQEFGDWPSALAGYNMHKDRYKKEKGREKAEDFYALRDIPSETLNYVFRAIAMKLIMEYPVKYGFLPEEINKVKYQPYPVEAMILNLNRTEKIIDIAARFNMSYREFRVINPHVLVLKNKFGEVTRDYLPKGEYKIYILKKS